MLTGTDGLDTLANATDGLKEIVTKTSCLDVTCTVRKAFVSHWILDGIKSEFVVENTNSWMPHFVGTTAPEIV